MKIVISHPTGNSFFRAAAEGLETCNMLGSFNTTVATFQGNIFDKMSTLPGLAELKRRNYNAKLRPFAKTWPGYELARMAATKAGLKKLTRHETGLFSVDGVYQNLDRHVAGNLKSANKLNDADAVYAYEDGALLSFREAKKLGIKCIYDLPIGYWRTARKLLEIERDKWPDWAATLTNFGDSEVKLARKDEELQLADVIFVASQFTATTLKDYPGRLAPIEIIPYGFPPVGENRQYANTNKPLKLLFVGGLSQRKGIANLFAAVSAIGKHVELTVVGHKATYNCPALDAALAKHHWIPSLPHKDVLKLMREHDVLVFPSLFEGFGLVITEAMSQGTPVITTDRTAGPDLIKHGENGWLVEAGSTQSLQHNIEDLITNRWQIAAAGIAAMKTAHQRPWGVYGYEIVEAIKRHSSMPK